MISSLARKSFLLLALAAIATSPTTWAQDSRPQTPGEAVKTQAISARKIQSNQASFNNLLSSIRNAPSDTEAKNIVASALTKIVSNSYPGQNGWHILSSLRTEHPRLAVTNEDLATVRDTIEKDGTAKHLYDALSKRTEDMLHMDGPKYTSNAGEALTQARLALKRLTSLAAMYRLTHDKKYFDRARKDMLEIAEFPDWGPVNFLDAAEMTASIGIGYDWLFNELSEGERVAIRTAIVEKGLDPALKQYQGGGWWRTSNSNWNFVCNGALSVGALAIAESEPSHAEKIIECAVLSSPLALRSLQPDGGWPEGPMYWTYGTRYLTYFLLCLQSSVGSDFGLASAKGLSETGFFRIYTESPIGKCFNYADSETEVARGAQMFWLSRKFHNPVFAGAELHISEIFPEMFHLLFYIPEHTTPADAKLPLNKLFKGVNIACLRSSWTDPSATFIGFKGGDNTSHHAHLDLGSFIFDVDGYRWAEDLGPDNYDLPGYFSKERWNYYRTRTEGHNTLTIESANQNIEAKSIITDFSSNESNPFAIADLSDAYKRNLGSVKRGVKLLGADGMIVQDEIEALNATPLEWHMHTRAKVSVSPDRRSAILTQSGTLQAAHPDRCEPEAGRRQTLKVEILCPSNASFQSHEVKFAPAENQLCGVTDLMIPLNLQAGETTITVRLMKGAASMTGQFQHSKDNSIPQKLIDWRK